MIIVDSALAKRAAEDRPVRVALIGAGFVARHIALQLLSATRGMHLSAIVNRTSAKAVDAYKFGGRDEVQYVSSSRELDAAAQTGRCSVTDDPSVVCEAQSIDVVVEATGHVEFGSAVALQAIRGGKHVVLMGAEVDASVGPILKVHADRAGVVVTYTDGDEPGVGMNLFRFLSSMGCEPVLMGQLKGFLDRYRNPGTQAQLAADLRQNATVLASFADGSKLALEAAIMGNATGFVPQIRGMRGYKCDHVDQLLQAISDDDFKGGGLVEYALGAAPHTGAFVVCRADHPERQNMLRYLKMGRGPFYMFYTPYHLPPWQVTHSIARAALFNDATIAPRGAPVCDTVSYAKRTLKAGEQLDGMGGYTCYGLVEKAGVCEQEGFLPIAISLDCRLEHDIEKDQPIRYSDVALPPGRQCDALREEQSRHFYMTPSSLVSQRTIALR